MTWIRNSGGAPLIGVSAPPPPPPPTGIKAAINIGGITDYSGNELFINRLKHTSRAWNNNFPSGTPITEDSNGYPTNILPGNSTAMLVFISLENIRVSPLVPGTGNWKITWDGPCVCTATGGYANSNVTVGNTTTFNLPSNSNILYIQIDNPTGVTQTCTNIKVFDTQYESALNAGEVFNPAYINWIASWPYLRFLRCMDIMQTNNSTVINPSDLNVESHRSWGREGSGAVAEKIGIPPSIAGRLAKKTGKDVWVCMPYKATDATMRAIAQAMFDADPTGTWKVYVEYSNENWNFGFLHWAYLVGVGSTLPGVVDGNGNPSSTSGDQSACASAYGAMRAWTAFETVFPRNRIIRVFGGQTDFPAFFLGGFQFRDTTNTLFGGQTMKALLNATDGGSPDGKGRVHQTIYYSPFNIYGKKSLIQNDRGAEPDSWWTTNYNASIDTIKGYYDTTRASLTAMGCTAPFITYEAGDNTFLDSHNGDFTATVNTTNNTLQFTADGTGWIVNNDILKIQGPAGPGIGFGQQLIVRKFGTNELRVYANQANYDSDAGNTGVNSITLTAGTWDATNFSRYNRIADKIYNMNNGTVGRDVLQYAINTVAVPHLDTFAQFVDVGANVTGTRFVQPFWLKPGVQEADNPRTTYLKSL
jgi:hypothetical protein